MQGTWRWRWPEELAAWEVNHRNKLPAPLYLSEDSLRHDPNAEITPTHPELEQVSNTQANAGSSRLASLLLLHLSPWSALHLQSLDSFSCSASSLTGMTPRRTEDASIGQHRGCGYGSSSAQRISKRCAAVDAPSLQATRILMTK